MSGRCGNEQAQDLPLASTLHNGAPKGAFIRERGREEGRFSMWCEMCGVHEEDVRGSIPGKGSIS
ncbi:MAG: hypothetical protein ABL949_00335 [Fimbriimonadaceae bacterium]